MAGAVFIEQLLQPAGHILQELFQQLFLPIAKRAQCAQEKAQGLRFILKLQSSDIVFPYANVCKGIYSWLNLRALTGICPDKSGPLTLRRRATLSLDHLVCLSGHFST